MNKKILKELKESNPTFKEYFDAKRIIEKYKKNSISNKKFYVRMDFDFYAIGTFGGWDKNGNFLLKIEDTEPYVHIKDTHYISTPVEEVFETKQRGMRQLHTGIE